VIDPTSKVCASFQASPWQYIIIVIMAKVPGIGRARQGLITQVLKACAMVPLKMFRLSLLLNMFKKYEKSKSVLWQL